MKKYIIIIIVLVVFSLICVAVSAGFYVSVFDGGKSYDREDWNTFGTFFGGILSPMFSFLSLLAVLLIFIFEMNDKKKNDEYQFYFKHLDLLDSSFGNMIYFDDWNESQTTGYELIKAILDNTARAIADTKSKNIKISENTIYKLNSKRRIAVQNYMEMLLIVYNFLKNSELYDEYVATFNIYLNNKVCQLIVLLGQQKFNSLKMHIKEYNENDFIIAEKLRLEEDSLK